MPLTSDRVKETTTAPGTGACTLNGAYTDFVTFSAAFANPTTVYYALVNTTDWEVGVGTFTTTLSRDQVLGSSNSGALVNFATGSVDVWANFPAFFLNLALPASNLSNYLNLPKGSL